MGVRSSNTTLKDEDDDYAHQIVIGDLERLSLAVSANKTAIAQASTDLANIDLSAYAQKASNLSDLTNVATARSNLGVAASGANADITAMSALTGTMTFTYAGSNTVVIASANFVGTGRAVRLREIDVCEGGVAKKMLILASATYT